MDVSSFSITPDGKINFVKDVLLIRGISDLIDDKAHANAANFQQIAAQHASAFAFEVLVKINR